MLETKWQLCNYIHHFVKKFFISILKIYSEFNCSTKQSLSVERAIQAFESNFFKGNLSGTY